MTRKHADRTDLTEGNHNEIRPIYREEVADCVMFRLFAERAVQLFLKTGDDYMGHPVLESQDLATRYQNSPLPWRDVTEIYCLVRIRMSKSFRKASVTRAVWTSMAP